MLLGLLDPLDRARGLLGDPPRPVRVTHPGQHARHLHQSPCTLPAIFDPLSYGKSLISHPRPGQRIRHLYQSHRMLPGVLDPPSNIFRKSRNHISTLIYIINPIYQ